MILAYGLQSGLSYSEMLKLTPGFIFDMFNYKQKYLAKLFGSNGKPKRDDSW